MIKENLIPLQQEVSRLRAEGKYRETIGNCYELLENGMLLKDYKSVLTAYVNLVASYYCIGNIEDALNIIIPYEETCNNYGDDSDKLGLYNSLFLLHDYNKDYVKAKTTLEKTIDLGKRLKKYNIVSNGYSNYSHVCMLEEDYTTALRMALIGHDMAKLHTPPSSILELRVKLNIAKAHIGLKNFDESKALIDEMINNPILDSFIREKAQCWDLLGHWYNKQELYKKSFETFTNAKVLVESYNEIYLLKSIQEERCRLCELMGDNDLGFKVQKEYIALLKEISERELAVTALKLEIKRSISALEKKVNTDSLTGIFSRSYIEETANIWLNQANEKDMNVSCIVFDIDKFKSINDNYGHLFGDEVIRLVSKASLDVLDENDIIGRYGGDEFVIISKNSSLEDAKNKAELILKAIRNLKVEIQEQTIPITVSIGGTDCFESGAKNFSQLFNAADLRLYIAKRNGKDQVWAG